MPISKEDKKKSASKQCEKKVHWKGYLHLPSPSLAYLVKSQHPLSLAEGERGEVDWWGEEGGGEEQGRGWDGYERVRRGEVGEKVRRKGGRKGDKGKREGGEEQGGEEERRQEERGWSKNDFSDN